MSEMELWWRATRAGWDSTPWCTPPEASVLADGWKAAAERFLETLQPDRQLRLWP